MQKKIQKSKIHPKMDGWVSLRDLIITFTTNIEKFELFSRSWKLLYIFWKMLANALSYFFEEPLIQDSHEEHIFLDLEESSNFPLLVVTWIQLFGRVSIAWSDDAASQRIVKLFNKMTKRNSVNNYWFREAMCDLASEFFWVSPQIISTNKIDLLTQ